MQVQRNELLAALKRCSQTKDLEAGKSLHSQALERRLHTNKFVATALINMYSRCGDTKLAFKVFQDMAHRDVVAWTSLLTCYLDNSDSMAAVDVFLNMDCKPDSVTLLAVLKACGSLAQDDTLHKLFCLSKGIALHKLAKTLGLEGDVLVSTRLIEMYRSCGSMTHARAVFITMFYRDTVAWNILILGYVENGEVLTALELFTAMQESCKPDTVTLVAAARACASGPATETRVGEEFWLRKAAEVHRSAREHGLEHEMMVAANFVDMYCKCRSMQLSWNVFQAMNRRDVVVWTSLINGYVNNGLSLVAVDVFANMDFQPDSFALVAALKACGALPLDVNFSLSKGGCRV